MKSLAMFQPGERGTVQELRADGAFAQRLMEMGFLPGTAIEIIRTAPLGDPIEVAVKGVHLAIRRRDALRVTLRSLE